MYRQRMMNGAIAGFQVEPDDIVIVAVGLNIRNLRQVFFIFLIGIETYR